MKPLALLLLLAAFSEAADVRATLEAQQLEAHQWFDLRDAVTSRKAPALYRFFVAAAFNDERAAEKELSALTRSGAAPEQLADAHFALYRLYYRCGYYRKAIMEMRRVAALVPNRAPSDAEKADAAAVELLPDTQVLSRRPAVLTYTNWPGQAKAVAPLTINGIPAQFAIDTDAGMSAMTEAEAKRLGMRMIAGQALFDGITGARATNGRYAVADRLKIGNTEIRNASFLVLPDDLEVFRPLPLGQRGALGLPVLIALRTIRWNRSHEMHIGFPGARPSLQTANLAFEDLDPLTIVEVDGRRIAVDLDTGSEATEMWPPLARDFPSLLRQSHKGAEHSVGATGAADLDASILPELRMNLAGFPIVLRDAPVLLNPTIPISNWHYGQLAMDTLSQATELTIDFKAMRVQLR